MADAEDGGLKMEYVRIGKNGGAMVTVRLSGEVIAVERIDLTKPKARTAFAKSLCQGWPGINCGAVERELLKMAADLAAGGQRTAERAAETPDPLALLQKMPRPVVKEALAMLEAPDLFHRIVQDFEALGIAGEKELAATLYLTGTSRLLRKPLAVIVQGPSSSGKSYVLNSVASMFPPEAVLMATHITPMALFYMSPGSLVHRWVVVGERRRAQDDETADATRALREMLSGGRLSKLVPIKTDGRQRTELVEQEGPIAYTETTTLTRIFEEDANRCILVNTDERPEQTRRVLAATAAAYSGATVADRQAIIDKHHALQRWLEPYEVVVPFAEQLANALDHHCVEVRRAFAHVLSLVQASALLHQRQRKVDGDGRLLADADDYQLARYLLAGPMARQLGGRISEPAARFRERLLSWFGDGTFTKPEAQKQERGSPSSVYGWLSELARAGLLEQVEEQRGNRAGRWQLTSMAPVPVAATVLPPVEELFPTESAEKHGGTTEPNAA